MRRLMIVLATLVVALALTTAAAAQQGLGPEGYVGPGEAVQEEVHAVEDVELGILPFGGQDLTFLVVGGIALMLAGAGFYRLSRRRT